MKLMNRARQPKSVSSLLNKSGLQHDMALITKLNSLLQRYLKQHNIQGYRIGNLQNGSLLIEIPDATWMMRLQFMRTELLTLLRKQVPALVRINIKVNPALSKSTKKQHLQPKKSIKRAEKMPADVADSLLALAENAEPELQAALRSLAKYCKH
ncbi:MAG TPA: DciA family protein [Psychromonas sp.]